MEFEKMSFVKIKEIFDNTDEKSYAALANELRNDSRKNVQNLVKKINLTMENKAKELSRVKKMYSFDNNLIENGYLAGVDEVGRGPLAGPIVAAAVILDLKALDEDLILEINDSKKLSAKKREVLSEIIKTKAVAYNIELIDKTEIDKVGIGVCNQQVLKKAVENLKIVPDFVLSDGYEIKGMNIKNSFAVKGDSKSASIACASIIAKVYRDNLMKEYGREYPEYLFHKNSGYGSKEHIAAIKKYGPCPIHRISFLKNILEEL